MSAARVGRWDLLDHEDDPVPAEPSGLDAVIKHYTEIADMMTTQAALLKKIGDGDETLLKGQSADAMRKRAGESHEHLGKAAERYEDVKTALVEYKPALETARSETGKALTAAETAADAQRAGEGMPDPVNADRPDDAPDLTESERQDSRDRENKINGAKADLEAAKSKCQAALEALQTAADRAATKIKENWGDDGLGHSGWEAFIHKVLKIIVEVLGWIGMVLAIVAMIIPGLQFVAWAALAVAVVALIGSTILAVTGESSWVNVIFGVLAVLTLGVGAVAMKLATAGKGLMDLMKNFMKFVPNISAGIRGLPGITKALSNLNISSISRLLQNIKPNLLLGAGPNGLPAITTKIGSSSWGSFFGNIFKPSTWTNPFKNWKLFDVIGLPPLDVLKNLSIFGRLGIPGASAIGPFVWTAGPLNFFWGFASAAIPLIMAPSDIFADTDTRGDWAWAEWDYLHNFTDPV
ncbi:hypothetical protein [Promicromonospora sukumoe]